MNTLTVPVDKRDHIRGSPDAPVVLVEYGDFECPHCGLAYPVVKKLERELRGMLAVVYRHFPITAMHPHAELAAEAAEAAAAQGKFWKMHDVLFENQDALAPEDLLRYAAAIGLDVKRFAHDLGEHTFIEKVRRDVMSGLESGVQGTPTFFINGMRHEGGYDEASLLASVMEVAEGAR
jgi:protein-disulfide isomerase